MDQSTQFITLRKAPIALLDKQTVCMSFDCLLYIGYNNLTNTVVTDIEDAVLLISAELEHVRENLLPTAYVQNS